MNILHNKHRGLVSEKNGGRKMKISEKGRISLYIILGSISLVLGTLGILLPLLPTVPFYLLTAWFYMRGYSKLYDMVMSNRFFGTIVRNFQENKAIPLKIKIIAVSMLWCSILLSAFLAVFIWWIRLILFAIAIGVTIHILSYKTKK
jgi:uncharacterized membrane protein YbaN (DUF454 family)